jgi:hypothetical protein
MEKSVVYFVCEKYPEDDFALDLDPKVYTIEKGDVLFVDKLSELPKLRLKLKDFLDYHFKRFPNNKIEFVDHIEKITRKSANEKVEDWIKITRTELLKSKVISDFKKSVALEEVPVKWADKEKELSTWIAKMVKEGYFVVKDPRSAEQFFEKLFL